MPSSTDALTLLGHPSRRDFKLLCDALGVGRTTAGRRRELGNGELMALVLTHRLGALGLGLADAAGIARQIDWPTVITSNGNRFLAAKRDARGWCAIVLNPDQFADLWRVAPEGLVGVHLGPIARSVLTHAAAHARVPA